MRIEQWIERCQPRDTDSGAVLGWAWATVDLERALAEAGEHAPLRWEPVEDELLGARGLRLEGFEPAVILLEPSTEGRLAGWLARNGEGEAATYREARLEQGSTRTTALGRPGRFDNAEPGPNMGTRLEILVSPITRGDPQGGAVQGVRGRC